MPSHYLNQCWVIVNWTLKNKLQWNFNQNTKLLIHENASKNFVCEMAPFLFRVNEIKMCLLPDWHRIITGLNVDISSTKPLQIYLKNKLFIWSMTHRPQWNEVPGHSYQKVIPSIVQYLWKRKHMKSETQSKSEFCQRETVIFIVFVEIWRQLAFLYWNTARTIQR